MEGEVSDADVTLFTLEDSYVEDFWVDFFRSDSDEDAEQPKRGGSHPGKRRNKDRDYQGRYRRLCEQYFNDDHVYNAVNFCRRFRMSKRLFLRVYEYVLSIDPDYFAQRPDYTGKMGIYPLLKIASALRVMAYGVAADMLDENLELAETTILDALRHLVEAIDRCFGEDYLRDPGVADMSRLLEINTS